MIISPMERRNFNDQGIHIVPSLTDYAEAARRNRRRNLVSRSLDLNAEWRASPSTKQLGKDRAYLAFAGTGTKRDVATHHDNYGAHTNSAKGASSGHCIRDNQLSLAKFIADDFKTFDPAHPDPVGFVCCPSQPPFHQSASPSVIELKYFCLRFHQRILDAGVLVIERVTYTRNDRPLEFVRSLSPGNVHYTCLSIKLKLLTDRRQ